MIWCVYVIGNFLAVGVPAPAKTAGKNPRGPGGCISCYMPSSLTHPVLWVARFLGFSGNLVSTKPLKAILFAGDLVSSPSLRGYP